MDSPLLRIGFPRANLSLMKAVGRGFFSSCKAMSSSVWSNFEAPHNFHPAGTTTERSLPTLYKEGPHQFHCRNYSFQMQCSSK